MFQPGVKGCGCREPAPARCTGEDTAAEVEDEEEVVLVGMLEGSLYALPASMGHSSTGIIFGDAGVAGALPDQATVPLTVRSPQCSAPSPQPPGTGVLWIQSS
jgi:hypothetical protein